MAGKISKILVTLDGSKNSLRGLSEAVELAKATGATVTGVFVYNPPVGIISPLSQSIRAATLKSANSAFNQAKKRCQKSNVPFKQISMDGAVGPTIVRYASVNKFDYIVMSSRGMSKTKSALLGSITSYVAHTSKVPVIIVN